MGVTNDDDDELHKDKHKSQGVCHANFILSYLIIPCFPPYRT